MPRLSGMAHATKLLCETIPVNISVAVAVVVGVSDVAVDCCVDANGWARSDTNGPSAAATHQIRRARPICRDVRLVVRVQIQYGWDRGRIIIIKN